MSSTVMEDEDLLDLTWCQTQMSEKGRELIPLWQRRRQKAVHKRCARFSLPLSFTLISGAFCSFCCLVFFVLFVIAVAILFPRHMSAKMDDAEVALFSLEGNMLDLDMEVDISVTNSNFYNISIQSVDYSVTYRNYTVKNVQDVVTSPSTVFPRSDQKVTLSILVHKQQHSFVPLMELDIFAQGYVEMKVNANVTLGGLYKMTEQHSDLATVVHAQLTELI